MALTNANPAIGDDGARQDGFCKDQSSLNSQFAHRKQPLRAEMIDATTCTAGGVTARASAPVLVLCRELLAAGVDPDQAMQVYRRTTLCLRIRSIRAGAALTVRETATDGPRFVRWKAWPDRAVAPSIRQNAQGPDRSPLSIGDGR